MATLRATFCMQTLAFPDPSFFHDYCKGAILYSVFEKPEDVDQLARSGKSVNIGTNNAPAKLQGLSLIYDHWYLAYEQNEQLRNQAKGQKPTNFFQSQRICALYDHFRANQVHFMHKSQMEATEWSNAH